MTNAVDKVRRPSASAGESVRAPGAALPEAGAGTGLGVGMAASFGAGLQAASAAAAGGNRQDIAAVASLNTAFATPTARLRHPAGAVRIRRVPLQATAAIPITVGAGDRSDLQQEAGVQEFYSVKFREGHAPAAQRGYQ